MAMCLAIILAALLKFGCGGNVFVGIPFLGKCMCRYRRLLSVVLAPSPTDMPWFAWI